jgi:UDP-N-acetylmuramoyl-tripeptide--D-alanyl-D-alanine ligase
MPKPEGMLRYRFGSSESSDLYPSGVLMDDLGSHFTLETNGGTTFYIPLLGHHNVINALAAIAVSKYMGVSDADVVKGLKSVRLTGMRIEQLKAPSGLTILNDAYNASPTSTKAAIELLQTLEGYRRKIIVLGDMLELGERETEYHEEIGNLLSSEQLDYVYAYGPLSREIVNAAAKRFKPGKVKWFETKEEIVQEVLRVSEAEDIVLVKASRGMKLEEVVNGLLELSN